MYYKNIVIINNFIGSMWCNSMSYVKGVSREFNNKVLEKQCKVIQGCIERNILNLLIFGFLFIIGC